MTEAWTVYRMTCGACGFTVSACTEERVHAAAFLHLRAVHGEQHALVQAALRKYAEMKAA